MSSTLCLPNPVAGCLLTDPYQRQGFLSRVHDALVSRRALIPIAQHLGIQRFMIASGRTMINGAGEPSAMPTTGCCHAHRHPQVLLHTCGLCSKPPQLDLWAASHPMTSPPASRHLFRQVSTSKPCPAGAANWERGLSADALEALVGAMHLDAGFEAARRFVEWVLDDAASVGAAHIDGNYKVLGLLRLGLGIRAGRCCIWVT